MKTGAARDWYMFEVIDGGAGAVASMPSTLLVFTSGASLLKHLRQEWENLEEPTDDDEEIERMADRIGVDEHPLWVVEQGTVVRRLSLGDFVWLALDGERLRMSDERAVNERLAQGVSSMAIHLDDEALVARLPPVTDPLTRKDGAVSVRWKVPRGRSHVGPLVRLGAFELGDGEDTFAV